MSMQFVMRRLAEESPRCMDNSDDAARALGQQVADELDIEDPSEKDCLKLGKLAWSLSEGKVRPSFVIKIIKTRRVVDDD